MAIVIDKVSQRERHPSQMTYSRYDSDFKYRWSEKRRKGRIYFSVQGETIYENLINRHDRPHKVYRTMIVPALKQLGYTYEEIQSLKFRWNQKAGCSCPCSPGFLVEGEALKDKDIWVTISEVVG